jgi:ATP-dependent DNA helicase RecQ
MGIDKSNIRWVLHYNLPNNVESFYQEIGRAGRDGLPAETLLLYSYGDLMTRLDMIAKSEADEEQKELRRAKLERMKQYAESQVCRRRILLSYFNEEVQQDCGNCDVCQSPRRQVEASVLAQKALSGIARSGEKVTMTSLVDLLRGVSSQVILKNNFQNLQTFGVGRDIRSEYWMDYLMQMLNTGVMDIAYDEGHVFKLNPRSWRILKGEEKVLLGEARTFVSRKDASAPPVSPKVQASLDLFERLRQLRKALADRDNVPPYMVFSDASLKDMVDSKPLSPATMMDIQGMSRTKYARYGKEFLQMLQQFASEKKAGGVKVGKGVTRIETLDLYRSGMMIEEIANQRGLNPGTIAGHLVELAKEGEEIDINRLISPARYKTIVEAARQLGIPVGEKASIMPLLEYFGERFQGWEIRLCLGFPAQARE